MWQSNRSPPLPPLLNIGPVVTAAVDSVPGADDTAIGSAVASTSSAWDERGTSDGGGGSSVGDGRRSSGTLAQTPLG